MQQRAINTLIPFHLKPLFKPLILLLVPVLLYLIFRFVPFGINGLSVLLLIGTLFLFIVSQSPTAIIKTIFWLTFINLFISHAFFRFYVFDFYNAGLSTRINWFADALLLVMVLRLISTKKYGKYFLNFNLFSLGFLIIILSSLFNFQSVAFSLLSLRVMYIPLLLAYVVYIYRMDLKTYEWFFKLFLVLAVINSVLSIVQFLFMEQLGFTAQMTGGIFGYHGTGTGSLFSVVQSALCLQIFMKSKKKVYLLLAFFIAIPIMTGFAYAGFAFLTIAIVVVVFNTFRRLNVLRITAVALTGFLIMYSLVTITIKFQTGSSYQSYFNFLGNPKLYGTVITNPDAAYSLSSLKRIYKLYFAIDEVTQDFVSFWVGHGPGSISYSALTLEFKNPLAEIYQGSSNPLMAYIYELGIWGPFFLITAFFLLYRKWKRTKRPVVEGLAQYYYDNINVLLVVYLLGTSYTLTLNNPILGMFFAVQVSYLNYLYRSQRVIEHNKNLRPA
jgi:hypothetical protein